MQPSPIDIATQVALADCNLFLAEERLQKLFPNSDTTQTDIVATLSTSREAQQALTSTLKLKALLESFNMMRTLTLLVQTTVHEYEAKDQLKALSIFSTLFTNLTSDSSSLTINNNASFNVYDKLLAILPYEVREAVKQLAPATPDADNDTGPTKIITHRQKKQAKLLNGTDGE